MLDKESQDYVGSLVKDLFGAHVQEERVELQRLAAEAIQPAYPAWMKNLEAQRTAGERVKGALFARTLACSVAQKLAGVRGAGAEFAKKMWGDDADNAPVIKALQAGDFATGGVWIDRTISTDFIEFLRPEVVVRAFNPRTEPMPNGTSSIRKQTGTTTATYRGENVPQNANPNPEYGWVHLSAKELIAKIPISNKLIRYAANDIEAMVLNDAREYIATREDIAFIRGDGTQNTPRGLRYWVNAANVFNANATVNHVNIVRDLGKAEFLLTNANIKMRRPGIIMSPRTENYLKYLLNAQGYWAFQAEMNAGKLLGKPYKTTTQVPDNLGGGSDESELYLVDFDHVVLGEVGRLDVASTSEASYKDSAGNVQSAFDNDETVVRVITEHDLAVRQDKAIAVITAVKWL